MQRLCFALCLVGVIAAAPPASAQTIRDRLNNRRANRARVYYRPATVVETRPVFTEPQVQTGRWVGPDGRAVVVEPIAAPKVERIAAPKGVEPGTEESANAAEPAPKATVTPAVYPTTQWTTRYVTRRTGLFGRRTVVEPVTVPVVVPSTSPPATFTEGPTRVIEAGSGPVITGPYYTEPLSTTRLVDYRPARQESGRFTLLGRRSRR